MRNIVLAEHQLVGFVAVSTLEIQSYQSAQSTGYAHSECSFTGLLSSFAGKSVQHEQQLMTVSEPTAGCPPLAAALAACLHLCRRQRVRSSVAAWRLHAP